MWIGTVPAQELQNANRWTVSFFKGTEALTSSFGTRRLGDIVRERGSFTDPQSLGDELINYLGLENIRPQTGELVDFSPRKASTVKSRSKVFRAGDVLFGRLRPELNKVFLAEGLVEDGICSTEFAVLIPSEQWLLPRYLRHMLASDYVIQLVSKFKAGAALPRVSSEDLLNIEIPVPPLSIQRTFVEQLKQYDEKISLLRKEVMALPSLLRAALMEALKQGRHSLALRD